MGLALRIVVRIEIIIIICILYFIFSLYLLKIENKIIKLNRNKIKFIFHKVIYRGIKTQNCPQQILIFKQFFIVFSNKEPNEKEEKKKKKEEKKK